MSIKDLFYNRKVTYSASLDSLSSSLESTDYIKEIVKDRDKFVPAVDYSEPSNFCFYGSAQKYYLDSIARIYNYFPYDGSKSEKLKWQNESSLLDNWMYDNRYPRTTGYAVLSANGWGNSTSIINGYGLSDSVEYIQFKGGPNAGSFEIREINLGKSGLKNLFGVSNVYDTASNRASNLELEPNGGLTLEFWLKKDSFNLAKTQKEVIFDLWNNEASSSTSYGRLTLELTGTNSGTFLLTLQSGTDGFYQQQIASSITTSSLTTWSHYAFSLQNNNTAVNVTTYKNGALIDSQNYGTDIGEINGSLIANIGALRIAPSGTYSISQGYGKLSASIDEFRYWKEVRNSKQIGVNWWSSVGGGSNTDNANTNLGVYYKFNEGITLTSSKDLVVLDYSGRTTNGYWQGYTSNSRNTGSAIDTYFSSSNLLTREEKDPIIYKSHPEVLDLINDLSTTGTNYDYSNSNSIYYTIPQWIVDEDDGTLLNLTQVISSYLDSLNLQIKFLPRLKDAYDNLLIENKPYPFSKKLLTSMGLNVPDLFIDANILELALSRNEKEDFQDKIHEIKNLIYQNIYHNLTYLYKAKGTEKSIRNLLHCFGIDEDLIKINLYSDNFTYEIKNNVNNVTTKKKYINFYDTDLFESTIYQYVDTTNSNSNSYISGTYNTSISGNLDYIPQTLEAEIYFPKKEDISNNTFFVTYFSASSLFGLHTAKTSSNTDLTWDSNDYANFQVSVVRRDLNSNDGYFVVSSSAPGLPTLSSSYFINLYDNEKWNLAVSVRPSKYGSDLVSGSTNTNYTFEFYGSNHAGDTKLSSFLLTSSITQDVATKFLRSPKRLYLGAEKTNFTGSIIKQTDVGVLSSRYWMKYLTNDEIDWHSKDPLNYGVTNPVKSSYLFQTSISGTVIPNIETLILHWQFDNVSSSDSNGRFTVVDSSSGSLNQYPTWFNNIKKEHHTGRGDFFVTNSTVAKQSYLFSSRQKLPELINSSDMIQILDKDDIYFTRNTRPNKFILSLEKNMYQTISEEMLHMFSSITELNNLIGNPINKYRGSYKDLKHFNQLFFSKVQNEPDLDKYLDFYKWVDLSIGSVVNQFIPASAESFENLQTIVESHTLERNKYQHKFPTLEIKKNPLEVGAISINRHLYNWKVGHRPLSNSEDENCFYWNERAERDVTPISSSNSSVNSSRNFILSASLQILNRSYTTPYKFSTSEAKQIKAGVNFEPNKNIEFSRIATAPHGPLDTDISTSVPANYLFVGIPNTSSLLVDCNDILQPNKKIKFNFTTIQGRDYVSSSLSYGEVLNSKIALPINFISGNVSSGYQSQVVNDFMNNVIITNIHNDTYGYQNEVAIQGPFTNAWVGGHQSRHVNINEGSDNYTTRPEAWKILLGTGSFTGSGYQTALGLVGADYPYPEGNPDEPSYPVRVHKRATYFREETAKRPLNIRNIQSTTGSAVLGNYSNTYEILNTFGATSNNRELLDATSPSINTELSGILRTNVTNGRVDFTLPTRQRSQTVIRNLFSAPGDYRTLSRGYLTRYSEETSPYNALPFRNRQIIGNGFRNSDSLTNDSVQYAEIVSGTFRDYNSLLAIPSIFGGYLSGSATVASLHKVNRNPVYVTPTSINYDNGFVTHQIPQKDSGYLWITASLSGSIADGSFPFFGHILEGVTIPSGSTSTTRTSFFTSASHIGSYVDTIGMNGRMFPEDVNAISLGGRTGFIPVDFVGLNTLVYETSSYTTLGEATIDYQTLVNSSIVNYVDSARKSTIFSSLNQHRNGPYGYPSFKQTRTSEHKVSQNLRNNNYISLINPSTNSDTIFLYNEPVVTTNYPLVTYVKDNLLNETIKLTHTYLNNLEFFSNEELESKYQSIYGARLVQASTYDNLLSLIQNNNRYEIERINVTAISYPSSRNETLNKTRERVTFDSNNNYWNTNSTLRLTTSSLSLFGEAIPSASIWLLDDSLTNYYSSASSAGGEGILQNRYSTFHAGNYLNITSSLRYNYVHTLPSRFSTKSSTASSRIARNSTPLLGFSQGLNNGNSSWYTYSYSGKVPFHNSYELWLGESRAKSKHYSIIPEFKISTKLQQILEDTNVTTNESSNNSFAIESLVTSSLSNQYDLDFATTSIDESIEIANKSITNIDETKINFSITCNVIKKFLPYEGFYPAQRAVDIATQFSNSYGNNFNFYSGTGSFSASVTLQNQKLGLRPIYTPLFAPGILFNTIKSGIAVDFPVLTSSLITANYPFAGGEDKNYQIGNNRFDTRLPFETILEPDTYLKDLQLIDMEPHISASINVTSSWNGNGDNYYKLMVNNYLAEIVNFYLQDSSLTSIQSNPEKQFKNVESNKKYRALLKIYKSINENISGSTLSLYPRPQKKGEETITMYSRPTAFGPATYGGKSNSDVTSGTIDTSNGYNAPFTPPYYDGEAWALLTYTPSGSGRYVPTLNEILSNTQINYLRYEYFYAEDGSLFGTTYTDNSPHGHSYLNQNAMQVSASLNIFDLFVQERQEAVYNYSNGISPTNPSQIIKAQENGSKLLIETKFETPILNFIDNIGNIPTGSNYAVPVGMWHQYGRVPTSNEGIYMQVTDIPRNYIIYGTEKTLATDSGNILQTGSVRDVTLTGSLVDIIGLDTAPKKLGKVANNKKVKEALVLIPYYLEVGGSKKLLTYNLATQNNIKSYLQGVDDNSLSQNIKDQVDKIKNYVVPPHLDFINDSNISPYSLYVFEFDYTFTQQDLVNMWQNVLPETSDKFSEESITIKHELSPYELMDKNIFTANKEIKFMTFKVKQKAKTNYKKLLTKNKNNDSISEERHSYNWPYDYFSIVESAQIITNFEVINSGSQ